MARPTVNFNWEQDLSAILRMSKRAKTDPELHADSAAEIDGALRSVIMAIVNRKVSKAPAKK